MKVMMTKAMKILKTVLLVLRRTLEQVSVLVQGELDSHDKLGELNSHDKFSAISKCFVFTMDFTFVQNSLSWMTTIPL